ncbi:MAG: hypothetical protein FWD05_13215, partial [Oscillospiraceae bacterium]|nr:hypothetical protein [Oscillospiraceae bacterium]
MMKATKKRIIGGLLALFMILTLMPSMAFALYDEEATSTPCCYDCLQGGYLDIEDGYQDIRVHYPDGDTAIYRVPVEDDEPEYYVDIEYSSARSTNEFKYERIRGVGRSPEDSIVVVLLGDGFSSNNFGTLDDMNTRRGTTLWYANSVIGHMLGAPRPFHLFEDLFIVYVVHYAPYDQVQGLNGYFGTIGADGRLIDAVAGHFPSGNWSRISRAINYNLPHTVGHQNMIHVLSNSSFGRLAGFANISQLNHGGYYHHLGVAVTS